MLANITDQDIYTAVRAFIIAEIPGIEVVQGYDNGVPTPEGGFIVMSMVSLNRLATNIHEYGEIDWNITQKAKVAMQVDCYGESSFEWACTLSTLLRDGYAIDRFPDEIKPLYPDDPQQLSFMNDSSAYEKRWMFVLNLQINPVLSRPNEND